MKLTLPFIFIASVLIACNDSNSPDEQRDADAIIASEPVGSAPLPRDVIYASSPLISGNLYARPSFGGTIIAHFDTSQRLHIIDTTDNVFVKVRMQQDTSTHTGYISKIILPQQK